MKRLQRFAGNGRESAFLPHTVSGLTEEMFRLVVEAAPNGMIMAGRDGKILLINTAVEAMFGYAREELIGQPVEMIIPPRFRGSHPKYRDSYLKKPQTRPMGAGRDLYGLRKDGTEVPVEIGLNPLITENERFVLASVVDITWRKKAEEKLKESLTEKELLLREIHHRVKNNLQIISSLLNLQATKTLDPTAAMILQDSRNRVQSMSLLHEKLYQATDLSHIDFNDYAKDLVSSLMRSYETSLGKIAIEIESDHVFLDINQAVPCGLIVNELIINAVKYAFPTDTEGVIKIQMTKDADGNYMLRVRDNGIGLPQGFEWSKTKTLGLRLVNALVLQLHGILTVEEVSQGTSFKITFASPNESAAH